MTSAISLPGLGTYVGSRAGERDGKGGESNGQRFADTLASVSGNSAATATLARERGQNERRLLVVDVANTMRLGLNSENAFAGHWRSLAIQAAPDEAEANDLAANEQGDVTALGSVLAGEMPKAAPSLRLNGQAEPPDGADGVRAEAAALQAAGDDLAEDGNTSRVAGQADQRQGIGLSIAATTAPAIQSTGAERASHISEEASLRVPHHDGNEATSEAETEKAAKPGAGKSEDAGPATNARVQKAELQLQNPAGRVSVIASNTAPAPALTSAQVLGSTAAGLVSDIASEPTWRSAAQDAAARATPKPGALAGVQTLRIQLHPIELGMVTARLTQSGSQMAIEIQVESNDARQRLASESDQIVKALKAVGIEIDKVTIQQTPQSATLSNANAQPGARDMNYQQQQQASADSGSKGQGERGTPSHRGEGARNGATDTSTERSGSGLYI